MKPILKLYRGYANEQELIVMGHVFKPTSTEDYNFQKRNLKNARSVIKLFSAKIQANADVYLEHNDLKIHTKTLEDPEGSYIRHREAEYKVVAVVPN